MSRGRVMTEINPETNKAIRIFNKPLHALSFDPAVIREMPRSQATEEIRRQVFEIDNFMCRHCGETVTWKTGHLDEIVPRSKFGQVSIENGQTLCADCHIGRKGKHGNRYPQFGLENSND